MGGAGDNADLGRGQRARTVSRPEAEGIARGAQVDLVGADLLGTEAVRGTVAPHRHRTREGWGTIL